LTIRESHENNRATKQEDAMLDEIAEILNRSRPTLVEDALGVVSLFVLLFAGLSLTGTV
jgi:predicted transcriptional regulator